MSLQDPMSVPEIEKAKQIAAESRRRFLIGVVWKDGRVTEHVCLPPELDGGKPGDENGKMRGHEVVAWINGQPRIRKQFEQEGCRLLKDVCRDDSCPEKYDRWRATVHARDEGYAVRGSNEDLYPPAVLRRRRDHASGAGSTGKVFDVRTGELVDTASLDDEALADLQAENVADKLDKAGVGRPSGRKKAASDG